MKVKVYNLESPRTGHPVANQFIIVTTETFPTGRVRETEIFQSYSTVIAKTIKEYGGGHEEENYSVIDPDNWDYSATTLKYLKIFLGLSLYSKSEIKKMIDDKKFKTANLN